MDNKLCLPVPNKIFSSVKLGIHPNTLWSRQAGNVCLFAVWWICLFHFCLSNISQVFSLSSFPFWHIQDLEFDQHKGACFHLDEKSWMQTWLVWQDLSLRWCTLCQGSCPSEHWNHRKHDHKTEMEPHFWWQQISTTVTSKNFWEGKMFSAIVWRKVKSGNWSRFVLSNVQFRKESLWLFGHLHVGKQIKKWRIAFDSRHLFVDNFCSFSVEWHQEMYVL